MKTLLRLLLVEDSEDDAMLLLRELRRGGYETHCQRVETGDEMRQALEGEWDLVIADYILPHFNGLEALRIMQDCGCDLPFIIVSGKIGEETAVEAMKAGAHDYLLKNNLARLVPAIRRELADTIVRRERIKAQHAHRESELRLQEAQKIGLMGSWEFNISTERLFWSNQMYRLFDRDPVYGPPSLDECVAFYIPESRELLRHGIRRAIELGERTEIDLKIIRTERDSDFHHTVIIPHRDGGSDVKRLVGIVQDITDRKRVEEQLKKTGEQLEIEREALQRKNIALREVLDQIDADKHIMKKQIATNIEQAVLPTLRRLKETSDPAQLRNLNLLEQELREIASPFLQSLKSEFSNLSARELEICRLIKNGLSSKDIARELNLSLLTVHKYRELIRKKLGLVNQSVNLNTHLRSF